jgi:crotonobetainyl-CoA:carnitine CoA-transferase CaiB-like acyl-CoA transferase
VAMSANPTSVGPYHDLRVLDTSTGPAGAMAAMFFADYGAEVVKVETVRSGSLDGDPGWLCWDRNKLLTSFDPAGRHGRGELRRLLAACDVAFFDPVPGELEADGLDGSTLTTMYPNLVHAWLPPYGTQGRWSQLSADPLLLAAAAGVCDHQQALTDVPVAPVVPILTYAQGALGATAVAAALLERRRSGRGQAVTVTGLHAVAAMHSSVMCRAPGQIAPQRKGGLGIPNYRVYRCRDEQWLYLGTLIQPFFLAALEVLGLLEVMVLPGIDGEFTNVMNPQFNGELGARLERRFAERDRSDWLEALDAAGVPNAPVGSRSEWFDSETVAVNDLRVGVDHKRLGRVDLPGLPVSLSITPGAIRHLPDDDHRYPSGVLWSQERTDVEHAPATATAGELDGGFPRVLEGLRVVDASSFIAGTFGPALLTDYGADVLKVEPPDGDPYRIFSLGFIAINQGKRGVQLDLKDPTDRQTYLELVAKADIVFDNLRPATAARMGIASADLQSVNPRVIHSSVSAFGTKGVWAPRRGFDPLVQALSGLLRAQGGDDVPIISTMPVHDIGGGTVAAFGALAALYARERTGEGQVVRTSLASVSVLLQSGELVSYRGRTPASVGGRDFAGPRASHRLYQCCDGWVAVAASTPAQREGLLRALDLLEGTHGVSGEELKSAEGTGPLASEIARQFAPLATEQALDYLLAENVPAARVLTRTETLDDPWLETNRVFHVVDDPVFGLCKVVRSYAEWSRSGASAPEPDLSAPTIGQHTTEVLAEVGIKPRH